MDYWEISLAMLAAQFSPGPDMLLLIRNALSLPLRAALRTVAGIATGLCVHSFCVIAGLAAVMREKPGVERTVSVLGGLYLGWLGLKLLRSVFQSPPEEPAPDAPAPEVPAPGTSAFMQGLLTNLLNPKAAVFILGFVATNLGPSPGPGRQAAFFAIIVGQALVFWSLFVLLLQRPGVVRIYQKSERGLNLVFGILLLLLAGRALWG